jgi:hypothetical protein
MIWLTQTSVINIGVDSIVPKPAAIIYLDFLLSIGASWNIKRIGATSYIGSWRRHLIRNAVGRHFAAYELIKKIIKINRMADLFKRC